MKTVPIGKGMVRIVVRSQRNRERLAKIPEVRIEGTRVIFPAWLIGHIERLLEHRRGTRHKPETSTQTELF